MAAMTSCRKWCTLVLTLCLTQGALGCTPVLIGGRYELNVSLAAPASLCIALDNSTQAEAIRVYVSSVNATIRHPVLVTVRQPMGVVSWALPHVESGFAYNSVERTLCPLLNRDDEANVTTLLVDLSTSQHTPLYVSLETSIVKPFKLEMNSPTTLQASPSGPSYLMYEYEAPPTRVRVRFTADDNSSSICAIASLQTAYCPVVELLDNPDHRGRYQTMKKLAAINTQVNGTRGFLYVVLTVFPSDGLDGGCGYNEGEGLLHMGRRGDNFNPTPYTSADRIKTVTITVETVLSDSGYAVAMVIATLVYASFYIVAIVWIIIFDWLRFNEHSIVKELESNPVKFVESSYEEGRSEEQKEDLVEAPPPHNRQDSSSEEEEEEYSAPVAVVSPDFGIPRAIMQQGHRNSDVSVVQPVKRPSMLSVMKGDHIQSAIGKATPTGSQVMFPSSRSRHTSESYTPATSPYGRGFGGQNVTTSLTPTPHKNRLKYSRQKSASESHNPGPAHSLTPSLGHHVISPTSPAGSHDTRAARIRMDSTTSTDAAGTPYGVQRSLNKNSLHPLKFSSRSKSSSESSYATPTQSLPASLAKCERRVKGQRSMSEATDNEGAGPLQRQDSYEVAVENGEMEDYQLEEEDFSFPINVQLSDVGTIDDSSFVQKKYNHYALYLLIVAVFYSIPAYQLVITSQRLLSSSGNEDLCYFNSLCSHSWDVYSGLTFSAFNNIFSNVGFFVLGFLYILIAYRRRRIYRSYEAYNCSKDLEERVGVPQRFGIHYAVGLALMAEGLMSTAYHICPSNTNYQFDTTFLYILAALGLHKLIESRSPDVEPGLHKIMLTLALITLVAVVGVVYSDSLGFWIVFFLLYVVSSFIFSVEVYYRWQLKPRSLRYLLQMYRRKGVWPPQHYPKFTIMVLSIILNWGFAVFMVATRPTDFGTIFFFCLLSNFILYLLYYAVTKCVYRERPSVRPLVFVILALTFWVVAIFFYTRRITDWSVPPAESRDGNQDCLILGFYDAHDMWHFLSAFALFFSFLMLMTLDDKQEHRPRNTLKAF